MLTALIAGQLATTPKSGTAASGTQWANCVVRCPCGQNRETGDQESAFVQIAAFGEHAATLSRLAKGDAVTAQGALKPTTYMKDGQERHGLSLTANGILTPYALKKKRGDSDRPSGKPAANGPDGWAVYDRAGGQDLTTM